MNNEKSYFEMTLRVGHDGHIPTWINTNKLAHLLEKDWRHNMSRWSAKPKVNSFGIVDDMGGLALFMPRFQMVKDGDGDRVHFLHNPDRVAWLLSLGLEEIPVAIYHDFDIEKYGTELGIRPMVNDETLRLPHDFNPRPIIDAIHAQQENIRNCETRIKDQMMAARSKKMLLNSGAVAV